MNARSLTATIVACSLALSIAGIVGLAPPEASGQVGASPAGEHIAVIDINYLLKKHVRFNQAMEGLKQQFKNSKERVEREQKALVELQEKQRKWNPGTAEYRQLDEEITRRHADVTAMATHLKKDIRNQEAQIFSSVYYEITTEVEKYARANNIGMVIQFNGDKIDPNDPQQVFNGIRRPIVYVAQNRDITPVIRDLLNRGANVPRANLDDRRQGVRQ